MKDEKCISVQCVLSLSPMVILEGNACGLMSTSGLIPDSVNGIFS